MANSNITKNALAAALKELMNEIPFEKINISQISEKCHMNRKSFYYHFKDKYDLMNWIFDTEFFAVTKNYSDEQTYEERFLYIKEICCYFYENRIFYRNALQFRGQNSFVEHFREYIQPVMKERILFYLEEAEHGEIDEFALDFLTDAIVCAFERWLTDKNCMQPEQLVAKFEKLIMITARLVLNEVEKLNTAEANF